MRISAYRNLATNLALWVLLLAVPWWLPMVGGYTALGSRILIFALGAMALNLLLGHTFVAIRENRRRATFLGIPVARYVWASFAIAGFIAGLAGALNALQNNFVSPADLYWIESGNFVITAVLGGMRSFWGPLVGAIIFIGIQDYVSSLFPNNWETLIGVLFIIVVLFFPNGILGIIRRRARFA